MRFLRSDCRRRPECRSRPGCNGVDGDASRSIDLLQVNLAHDGDGTLVGGRPGAFSVEVEDGTLQIGIGDVRMDAVDPLATGLGK